MPSVPANLAREWERRLKDSGFDDIEYSDGSLRRDRPVTADDDARAADREEYYRLARRFAYDYRRRFHSRRDRHIWELHAEGKPSREIAAALGLKSHHVVVDATKKYSAEMRYFYGSNVDRRRIDLVGRVGLSTGTIRTCVEDLCRDAVDAAWTEPTPALVALMHPAIRALVARRT